MSPPPPSPHKIHSLPVIVHYNLPSTSQTFTTLFDTPQQVYVHASSGTSDNDTQEDVCGSIYLKTVVQEVITASPELHPCHPSTPDLTLYIHDPRETSLRRSRVSASLPSLRHGSSSSPAGPSQQPVDVWTGKGLVSWALDEPGLGKQLITGRIVRSASFAGISTEEGLGGLAALMRADYGEAWGIELSLCLKSGNERIGAGMFGTEAAIAPTSTQATSVSRTSSSVSSISQGSTRLSKPSFTAGRPPKPVDPTRGKRTPGRPAGSKNSTTSRKKKCTDTSHSHAASHPQPHAHARTSPTPHSQSSSASRPSQSQSSDSEGFPDDIPAITNTQHLTQEQAFRLIHSPAFLNEVARVTGVRITQDDLPEGARGSAKRVAEGFETSSAKKPKTLRAGTPAGSSLTTKAPVEDNSNALKCWNCGRTKSAVWRTKVMEDGNSVRVCNACGLYWNKNRDMRPPSMWDRVDEAPKVLAKTVARRAVNPTDTPASRIDAITPSVSGSGGLKRTLSRAVEQDAKRIAQSRVKPKAVDTAKRAVAASSPVRPPMPRDNTAMPRTKLNQPIPASSPAYRAATPPRTGDTFDPVPPQPQDTPNTAIRKMLAPVMQSLSMPLSDDGAQAPGPSPQFDWNTDLSAFFDLEGFSLPEVGTDVTLVHSDHVDQMSNPKPLSDTRSDDAISQLFNPSSIGTSSPAPFDFSQLPPSSPPVMSSELGHSALLLSSPDLSPWERKTSPPKSTTKSAFTPLSEISTNEMVRSFSDIGPQTMYGSTHGIAGVSVPKDDNPFKGDTTDDMFSGKSMEELFGQMIAQSQAHQRDGAPGSSTAQVEGMMDDELFSFLEKSLVNDA